MVSILSWLGESSLVEMGTYWIVCGTAQTRRFLLAEGGGGVVWAAAGAAVERHGGAAVCNGVGVTSHFAACVSAAVVASGVQAHA